MIHVVKAGEVLFHGDELFLVQDVPAGLYAYGEYLTGRLDDSKRYAVKLDELNDIFMVAED